MGWWMSCTVPTTPGMRTSIPNSEMRTQLRIYSGRLPYTIGKAATDYAAQVITSGSGTVQIPYNEGLFIDYRYFDQNNITPRFEYGFGLSYTTFQYSNLAITGTSGGGTAPTGPGSSLDPWLVILLYYLRSDNIDPNVAHQGFIRMSSPSHFR